MSTGNTPGPGRDGPAETQPNERRWLLWGPHVRLGPILGIAPAVGAYGLAFGVLAREAGLAPLEVLMMSALVHAGGAQFVFVATLTRASPLIALASAVLVNLRFGLYGAMVRPIIGELRWPARLVGIHFVGDEQVALAMSAPRRARLATFYLSGVILFTTWTASTYLGAILGSAIGDPSRFGLDAAFPAVFVALLIPLLKEGGTLVAAGVAAAATVLAIPFIPSGLPVVVAALTVALVLVVGRRVRPETGMR